MTIMVTGGAGFIGSNFIFHILDSHSEDRIVCADCLTYAGHLRTLAPVLEHPRLRFFRVNITDRDAIERLFAEEHPDIVVNLAAESDVDRSIRQPEIFLETNLMGTAILLDACRKYGIRRFHQISTDEVYGELPADRPELLFTEESTLRAGNPYSASKAGADQLALAYFHTYGLPVSISRCSNNFGPYQLPEKLIPRMITNALRDQPLPVYGSGEQVRDWIYVEDHCQAVDLIIRHGRAGRIYNVGARNERKNIELVKMICRELGKSEKLITGVADRLGHDRRYAVDPTRIREELGWEPQTKFEDGMKRTIRWYLEHRDWWEPILSETQKTECSI